MAVRIQLRRGNNSEFSGSLVLTAGEAALVEDEKVLIVGDGSSTYTQLKAAGKFINYQTEQGLGVVGGAHGTGEIPLTIQGVGSQTVALLKVEDSSNSAILEIFDDEGPTVRLEDHGEVGEVFMRLKQQASQTANALELKDSGDTDQLVISCDGEVAITPTNNQTADAPSLSVKGSTANNSQIFKVHEGSNDVVVVANDGTTTDQPLTVRKQADSTDRVVLTGNDTGNVIEVFENNVSQFSVDATGKVVADDVEIDVTGRTLSDASLVRLDEIKGLIRAFERYDFDTGVGALQNGGTNDNLRIVNFATTDGSPTQALSGNLFNSAAVITSAVSADATDPNLLVSPSSSVFPAIKLEPGESCDIEVTVTARAGSLAVNATVEILRYDNQNLASSTLIKQHILNQSVSIPTVIDRTFQTSVTNETGSAFFMAIAAKADGSSSNGRRAQGFARLTFAPKFEKEIVT
tara:strand:- start:1663 stop:3051 length:1389 start_codon:yes stop_codon:yes gene_type:complete